MINQNPLYIPYNQSIPRILSLIISGGLPKRDQNRNMTCNSRHFLFISLIILSTSCFGSSSPKSLLQSADSLLLANNYTEAILLYDSLTRLGYGSAHMWQNAAYASLTSGNHGMARWFIEKARKVSSNPDVINLQKDIQSASGDQYQFPSLPGSKLLLVIRQISGKNGISILAVVLSFGLAFLLFSRISIPHKKRITYAVSSLLLVTILLLLLQLGYHKQDELFMINQREMSMHEAPDQISQILLQLNPGYMVKRTDVIGDWLKIELADGTTGWVPDQEAWMRLESAN